MLTRNAVYCQRAYSKIANGLESKIDVVVSGQDISFRGWKRKVSFPCLAIANGHYYCLDHEISLDSETKFFPHLLHGDHRIVWMCCEHGFEKP